MFKGIGNNVIWAFTSASFSCAEFLQVYIICCKHSQIVYNITICNHIIVILFCSIAASEHFLVM
jgi:hypothetical protein